MLSWKLCSFCKFLLKEVYSPWIQEENNCFAFSIYGKQSIEINRVPLTFLHKEFIQKIFVERALLVKDKFKSLENLGQPDIFFHFEHCHEGIGYFWFENKTESVRANAQIRLENCSGFCFCKF